VIAESGDAGKETAALAPMLYGKACDGNHLEGCTGLGRLHILGASGADKDPKKARELFSKACDGGELGGCYNLALAMEKGLGGKRDRKGAKALKAQACEGGLEAACGKKK
jgi:TPR repeat protein